MHRHGVASKIIIIITQVITIFGVWDEHALTLVTGVGRWAAEASNEPRSTTFPRQHLAVAVQCGNAACIFWEHCVAITARRINNNFHFIDIFWYLIIIWLISYDSINNVCNLQILLLLLSLQTYTLYSKNSTVNTNSQCIRCKNRAKMKNCHQLRCPWSDGKDFLQMFHCNFASITHRFPYFEMLPLTGNDVISKYSPGGAAGKFWLQILEERT